MARLLQGIGAAEAVQYLRSLPVATREEWERVSEQSRRPAFTAAGVGNRRALEALRNLAARGAGEGWTTARFEAEARALLQQFQQRAGSLRTLWHTVTANALARGREEMLLSPEVRSVLRYWLYDAVLDVFTRPNHRLLDGGIAPAEWEGWALLKPPNGYNCRCTIIGIGGVRARKLIASGPPYYDLTQGVPAGAGPDEGFAKFAEAARFDERAEMPRIRAPRNRASREAVETQLDLQTILAAAVIEQIRHFARIRGALLAFALEAFRGGVSAVPAATGEVERHALRLAELLAAARILGRARVRHEAGLPMAAQQEAA